MQFDLGIRAGHFLSMKDGEGEVKEDIFIGINGNLISEICSFKDALGLECTRFLELSDQVVMPGLVNGHTHLAMSLFRGYEDDVTFHDWLFNRIFPAEKKMVSAGFVRIGTELSALECIRFGTTTVNDMYFHSEVTAKVIDEAGLRAIIAWPFMDFPTPDEIALGKNAVASRPERFKAFFNQYQKHPRIKPALGPHAPYTCSDELIREVTAMSHHYQVPVHMHVCETCSEVEESIKKYGKTPGVRLHELGALHSRFIAAHGIHLTDEEVGYFKDAGASIIYNPDSNLKLGSGIAPIPKYRKAGIAVGLGSDGAASNNDLSLFGAMDLGTKLQKGMSGNNTIMVALDALNLATLEGARALGLSDQIGSIEIGKRADLIGLRTDFPHVTPMHSVLSQLVYSYQGLEVDHVICDGKLLLDGGAFTTLDSARIYSSARAYRAQLKSLIPSE
jgi:5-methylthioadenosine/S-adenosylhomocysteine deaminase